MFISCYIIPSKMSVDLKPFLVFLFCAHTCLAFQYGNYQIPTNQPHFGAASYNRTTLPAWQQVSIT